MKTFLMLIIAAMVAAITNTAPAQTAPPPITQDEVDRFGNVAEEAGMIDVFRGHKGRIDSLGVEMDGVKTDVDSLRGKVNRLPTSAVATRYTGPGANFLRVVGDFAHSWRDSVELDTFAANKQMSRDDAAQLADWLDLKRSFRTSAGRRETAEMYLTWLEAGGRAADLISATGVQTPTTGSSVGPFASETSVNVALAAIAALEDSVKALRSQIKPLAEAAVSGEINALRTSIKDVANKAGEAANERASKDARRAAVAWLVNYGR